MIPTLTLFRHSFWHIIWKYIRYNLLTFYSGILPGILSDSVFWHSIWHLFWHPIWHPWCHLYWHFLLHFFCHMFWQFLAYVLACYISDILFWHSIWHVFWHSFLAFYLVYLQRFFVVEVRRGTLWSWACSWGPAEEAEEEEAAGQLP